MDGIPIKYFRIGTKVPFVTTASVKPAPQVTDRSFHLQKKEYGVNSIRKALSKGVLTERDAELIHSFVAELKVTNGISLGRANKITFTLVSWRHFIGQFDTNRIIDLYEGIEALKAGENREKPYKQNTIRDFLSFLKRFYSWLIDNGISDIPMEKVQAIKVPRRNSMTKTAEQILTESEILSLLKACQNSRDRALIAVLYEGGFRSEEIGQLTWGQVKFDEWGTVINVNAKTERPRHVRLIMATRYLIEWKNDYPCTISNEGLVFLTSHHNPLQWATVASQLRKIAARAGLTKTITPHLFRHSRVTHLLQKGYSETTIKKMMWGNMNTAMLETYVHLTDADIDNEVLSREGIRPIHENKTSEMAAQQCNSCHAINPPTHNFCSLCGKPLNKDTEQSMKRIKDEIENSPEYRAIMDMVKEKITLI